MKYTFDKKYFDKNDKDVVVFKKPITFDGNSNPSQKVLAKLCKLDKPYVLCDDCKVHKGKATPPKVKNKKVKVDEPKAAKEELQEELQEEVSAETSEE